MRFPPRIVRANITGPYESGMAGVESVLQVSHRSAHMASVQRLSGTLMPVILAQQRLYYKLHIRPGWYA